MPTISISQFKAKCLSLLQDLNETNEPLIITKYGKPFAEVRPCAKDLQSALEKFRGSVVAQDDLVSPIDEDWEAAR
ncbi:MAG: type II toxin-antitoxin system Phd/YefM family antitoxin [Candidatus Latescibacteria bacterium]|nr:type II toxin-antitoxin system Phd/YefM family antitoxin [Candidatus Latescibacterota bacterium]